MKRYCLGLAVLAGLIGVAGCGPSYTKVEGAVQYDDGGPVEGANVVFVPLEASTGGANPSAMTDAQGNFSLKSGKVDGARKGKYKVLISKIAAKTLGEDGGAPSSKGAIDMMKKSMAKGGGGLMPGKPQGAPQESEILEDYNKADKTPFTADVPTTGPLTFKVKKKPKK